MKITIRKVNSPSERKAFIYLPEKIQAHNPTWLHPIYLDEEKFFNPQKNPAFRHNHSILLLAYRNGKPVGRIMGIVPLEYNKKNNLNRARFAYFECFQEKEIFDALLNAVEEWARGLGCGEMEGPMGFSDKEPQGFLMKGYQEPTMMVTNCSLPFMAQYIQEDGYLPHIELCQYDVPITPDLLHRYQNYVQRVTGQLHINILEFTSTKAVRPYVKAVFDLINNTYQEIYGFSSLSEEEMNEFADRFLPLLNPHLIKLITDKEGKLIAFVVAMPDFSEGLRRAKGRILPFGWYHIWRAAKKSKRLVLLLGSIDPAMQNKGLDAVLATKLFSSALKLGFQTMDSHIIMRENHKMRSEIERLSGFNMYKEYTIFSKKI